MKAGTCAARRGEGAWVKTSSPRIECPVVEGTISSQPDGTSQAESQRNQHPDQPKARGRSRGALARFPHVARRPGTR